MNFIDTVYKNGYQNFLKKKDNLIRLSLIDNGFNPDNTDFSKENITIVRSTSDKYEHVIVDFGLPTEKRIISIQHHPDINFEDNCINWRCDYF